MKRDELLEHLTAICDTENAIHACRKAIEILSMYINDNSFYERAGVQFTNSIPEPQKIERFYNATAKNDDNILFLSLCGIGAFILCLLLGGSKSLLMMILSPLFGIGFATSRIEAKEQKEKQRIKEENEINQHNYEEEMKKYRIKREKWNRQQSNMYNQIKLSLQSIINENRETLSGLEARLRKLYGMGIVYSRFQNMVAMNTMREYVEMGLCDKLEGSDGAYGVYLQDLRMDKICGSIEELKRATVSALSVIAQNQEKLIHEVREIDEDMMSLERTMNQNLTGINQNVRNLQDDLSKGIRMEREQTQMLSQHIQRMERTLRNAAYNDYIQKRLETTDRYLRTHYRAPNA